MNGPAMATHADRISSLDSWERWLLSEHRPALFNLDLWHAIIAAQPVPFAHQPSRTFGLGHTSAMCLVPRNGTFA